MSAPELPRELPGDVREPDDALDIAALDALRARIGRSLDDTQGAWRKLPMWKRAWPLAVAALSAAAFVAWILSHVSGGIGVAAALAFASAAAAFVAVARAPLHPGTSERVARFALAGGCLALAAEIGLTIFAPPVDAGPGCAVAIIGGALAPLAALALYLRASTAPARLFHVVALAGAAFLASAAAVWAECPGTTPEHIIGAHVMAPLVVAGIMVLALRALLRGAPLSP